MKLSYRRLLVDGSPVGLLGLREIFEDFYANSLYPGDDAITTQLISRAKAHNYIPKSAQDAYGSALLNAYAQYVAKREGRDTVESEGYGTWRGYPREQIPWFPSVNADLCDGCGKCLSLCASKALAPADSDKVKVDDPFRCVVGCSSCANICKPGAITFPPRSMLEAYPWQQCC
jgi:NAD-dependent dihydropyrimidine dehydrogenase PreA subunit